MMKGIAPAKILRTFQAFVETVHDELPKTRIYFLAIKPSRSRWELWPIMAEANELIEGWAASQPINFVDGDEPPRQPRLTRASWRALKAIFAPYRAWLENERGRAVARGAMDELNDELIQQYLTV